MVKLRTVSTEAIAARNSPLKNRRRGESQPLVPPDAVALRRLYVGEGRSLTDIADRLGASAHLVRTWMSEAGIPTRPPGGQTGRPHQVPRRKLPPPVDELRHHWLDQRLTRAELAERYRVHPQTITRWLVEAGLPTRHPPVPLPVPAAELARLYGEGMTAAEIADNIGVDAKRVVRELRAAGVTFDTSRRLRALRDHFERRAAAPVFGPDDAVWVEQRYVVDRWPMSRIAAEVGRSVRVVRRHLVSQGIEIVRHPSPSREDRREAPVDNIEKLYVREGHSAEAVGEALEVGSHIVLRTGHSYGVPIRPGGQPVGPAEVRLIEALYDDEEVRAVLERHGVEPQPAIGGIAIRFPEPVPLTAALIADLYHGAGCSSVHVELLTGQAEGVVRARMHAWRIPFREQHRSPVLTRVRQARRSLWLDQVVEQYKRTGSTTEVAAELGCATETVRRWLLEAGVAVPGRGRWARQRHPA
jgi:transposase